MGFSKGGSGSGGGEGKQGRNLFFYRGTAWKTTWKFRILLLLLILACFFLLKGPLQERLAESLVCQVSFTGVDAVIIENFDPNYLLFEAVSTLKREGLDAAVYVPVSNNRDRTAPNRVSREIVEAMARVSRLGQHELIQVDEVEPIRLNAALQVRDRLREEGIKSILIVSPAFCSRRSFLVYQSVFASTGVKVTCLPVFGERNPSNWTDSWHGIQEVFLEFGKLWYYRLAVL